MSTFSENVTVLMY